MKRVIALFIFSILIMGFAMASLDNSLTSASNSNSSGNSEDDDSQDDNGTEEIKERARERIKEGEYELSGSNGEKLTIKWDKEKLEIKVKNMIANTGLNLTQEQIQNRTKLMVSLNNGRNAEIKIMPDTASERALERLRLKVCNESNNCTLELKEVGEGNKTRLAYEVKVEKEYKILWMIKTKSHVQAQIDAENGEVISEDKPWWSVISSESED